MDRKLHACDTTYGIKPGLDLELAAYLGLELALTWWGGQEEIGLTIGSVRATMREYAGADFGGLELAGIAVGRCDLCGTILTSTPAPTESGSDRLLCSGCADLAAGVDDVAECLGHPAGPFDPMGSVVFCDGSCR